MNSHELKVWDSTHGFISFTLQISLPIDPIGEGGLIMHVGNYQRRYIISLRYETSATERYREHCLS